MGSRPLDVLEAALEETVLVQLKDGTTYHGRLAGYDQHLNLVLEDAGPGPEDPGPEALQIEPVEDTIIIRGDNVVSIRP